MAPSVKPYFYGNLTRHIFKKYGFINGAIFLYHILFSKMNTYHLAISYDNRLFIYFDGPGDGNYLFRVLVESDIIPISDSKTFRSDLLIRTKTLLKNRSFHGRQIRNYFNNNEKSNKGGSIEDYIDFVMSANGKWGSIFEVICVSIIYRVRIISIANISGGFMISDTLFLRNDYQIVNDNSVMSDRYIYLYCHLYNASITLCTHDIILNHFVYLQVIEESYKPTLFVKFIIVIVVIMNVQENLVILYQFLHFLMTHFL